MISRLIKSYSAGAVRRNLVETETKPRQTQWSLIGDNHHHLHQVIMPKLRPNYETSVRSLPFSCNLIFWWLERCCVVIEYRYRKPLRHCWCLMTSTFLDLMHYRGLLQIFIESSTSSFSRPYHKDFWSRFFLKFFLKCNQNCLKNAGNPRDMRRFQVKGVWSLFQAPQFFLKTKK